MTGSPCRKHQGTRLSTRQHSRTQVELLAHCARLHSRVLHQQGKTTNNPSSLSTAAWKQLSNQVGPGAPVLQRPSAPWQSGPSGSTSTRSSPALTKGSLDSHSAPHWRSSRSEAIPAGTASRNHHCRSLPRPGTETYSFVRGLSWVRSLEPLTPGPAAKEGGTDRSCRGKRAADVA